MTDTTEPTTDAWKNHALAVSEPVFCIKDGATPGPDDDPQAWFASHLEAEGCPDYVVEFERTWRGMVADGRGGLEVDKVAREFADYRNLLLEVPKVYDEMTGGRFSKPNTKAEYIIEAVDERAAEDFAERLCEEIGELEVSESVAVRLAEIADSWSPGAWDRFEELQQQRAEAAAARAAAAS